MKRARKPLRCGKYVPPLAFSAALLSGFECKGQFSYSSGAGGVTITKFDGSIADLTVPETIDNLPVIGIADYALNYITGLRSVTLGAAISQIGVGVFVGNPDLESIHVAPENTSFTDVDGVLFTKDKTVLVEFPSSRTGSFEVPAGVLRIGSDAFHDSRNLTNITLPTGLLAIDSGAFANCVGLTGLALPDSLTAIEDGAFSNCAGLRSITIPPTVSKIGDYAFSYCGLTNMTVPHGVIEIGNAAFASCTNLTTLTVSASVKSLGVYAFSGCSSLQSIFFGGAAPVPGNDAFVGDPNLTVYPPPGAIDWPSTFGSRPTVPWNASVGVNDFGVVLEGTSGLTVVVEQTADLSKGNWTGVSTNQLAGSPIVLHDLFDTLDDRRFFRLRMP